MITFNLKWVLAVIAFTSACACAQVSDYPMAPVKIMVGFAAGGGTDIAARIVAEKLALELGQSIVIENRAGAGGTIAAQAVARAKADGYTLLFGSGAEMVINPVTRKVAQYSVLKDFEPVGEVGAVAFALVVPVASPAADVQSLVSLVRTRAGKTNFSSFGIGSTNHLIGELFVQKAGGAATHVPYQGSAPAMTALLAGEIDFSFETASVALPQVRAGKLKALATPSRMRLKELPEVPTLQEAGFRDFIAEGWLGVFAPAGTPQPVVQRLNQALAKVLAMPDVVAKLTERGVTIAPGTPEAFRAKLGVEVEKWSAVARQSGIALD
jgi:tripartite-type tricarboxylate transporter receptor subunit TctC